MESFTPFSLNIGGRLHEYSRPVVMGILNATPDSFFAGSRASNAEAVAERTRKMIEEGADMIDVGGCSTRPGFEAPSVEEETRRVVSAIETVRRVAPEIVVSVDTFRGKVAREAVAAGADIINDISAFTLDESMYDTVAELKVPYILMHPSASSLNGEMERPEVTATVIGDLQQWVRRLTLDGVSDVIVDPGFGFGKTLDQNYRLMDDLEAFRLLGCPVLVGISRKSMINKVLGTTPSEALNGTTVLNTVALMKGASILRVHDVAAAREAVEIVSHL